MNSTTAIDPSLVESTISVLEQMSAALAVDGMLAGPAGVQESIDDLVVSDRVVGCWAELSDGSVVAVLASEEGALRLAGSADPDALASVLADPFAAVAAGLGAAVLSVAPVLGREMIPGGMTPVPGLRTLVGAGIFDGDSAIASVGLCRPAVVPASGGDTSNAGGAGVSMPAMSSGISRNLHLLADVTLGVTAELGSTTMTMGGLLDLQPGGVIELDREAGAPIDLLVNGTLIARGEVVVAEGQYAVRVTEVVAEDESR